MQLAERFVTSDSMRSLISKNPKFVRRCATESGMWSFNEMHLFNASSVVKSHIRATAWKIAGKLTGDLRID